MYLVLFFLVNFKKRGSLVGFLFSKVSNGIGETILWRIDRMIFFIVLILLSIR